MTAPGTLVSGGNPLESIPSAVWQGGGLTLGQVKDLTGLDSPAIQNWIKRGYVAPPENRKYSKDRVARILTINALRETMKLETVAKLISYVNGSLVDSSDDLIPDSQLYDMFCRAVEVFDGDLYVDQAVLRQSIAQGCSCLGDTQAAERIARTLMLMCTCYRSIMIKRTVDDIIEAL